MMANQKLNLTQANHYGQPRVHGATQSVQLSRLSKKALSVAASGWATTAVLGQLLFALYVVVFYWGNALNGNIEQWSEVLPNGYQPGQTLENTALISHMVIAAFIMLAGGIQLLPWVRQKLPKLHRWSGRLYIGGVLIAAVGGLIMVWYGKGTVGDIYQHLGISLDAILIIVFAGLAGYDAVKGRYSRHRRWALRLFLVANAVWFFRISFSLWLMVNQGPAGFDPKTFTGPFLTFLSFFDYLIPLMLLELYFYVQRRGQSVAHFIMAGVLVIATLMTIAGTFGAINILWLPRL